MTTVVEIITDALQDLAVYGSGEAIGADDAQKCLRMLNRILAQWQVQKLYVPGQYDLSFSPTGASTYTIGIGGTINAAQPPQIDAAFFRLNNVDSEVLVLNSFEDYSDISLKTIPQSYPTAIYLQRGPSQGTLYVWPQSNVGEIHMVTRQVLTQYTALTDDINVPPEYALALQLTLEEMVARTFGKTVTPDLKIDAQNARRVIKKLNLSIPAMTMPSTVVRSTGSSLARFLSGR